MGGNLPMSYLVQEHNDPVTGEYLARIGVQVIELFSWNELPEHELPGARMLLTRLRDHGSAIVIVYSSRREESEVWPRIQAGAVGYLCRDTLTPEALASAVRAAASGAGVISPEVLGGNLRGIARSSL